MLVALAIASYTDTKKGLIFDWLTIPMILVGLTLNFIETEFLGIAVSAAVFFIGYLVYYAGKIGGGDVKLFTGASMLLPFFGGEPFVLSLAFVASITSVLALSVFFLAKYFRKGISFKENREGILKATLAAGIIAVYFGAMIGLGYLKPGTAIVLGIPTALGLVFVGLEKGLRKNFFLQKVKLGELEEDEIIATDFLEETTRKELNLRIKGVLGKKEIEKLKSIGVKEVPVYRSLPPFAPFAFIGAIAVFLKPGILGLVLGA